MVRLVSGGPAEFNAIAYQERHPTTLQFLANQFQNVSSTFTGAGQRFLEGAKELYEKYNSFDALRQARALARAVTGSFQGEEIRDFRTIEETQRANLRMQRLIMAEPFLRNRYHQQQVNGYSDTYVDMYPEDVGERHYDYRLVMDGVVVPVPADPTVEGDEEGWKVTWYFDEMAEGDRPLDVTEVAIVQNSVWNTVKYFVEHGDRDPTDVENGKL